MCTGKENTLHASTLIDRNPARENASSVGPCSRFSGAEKEAGDQQDRIADGGAREHGEGRPPQHDAREYPATSNAIGPPGSRNLKQCVGESKGRKRKPHL